MSNEFIKKIIVGSNIRTLFKRDGKYYVASDNGRETLVFPSNKDGDIVDFLEVIESWASINNTKELFSGNH